MTAPESIGNPLPMADTERDSNTGGTNTTSPGNAAGSSPIVYARRKPETDLTKTKFCDAQIDRPGVMNSGADKLDNPLICASDVEPFGTSAAENIGHGNGSDVFRANAACWEERYCRLQNVLRMLDQSDQHEYVQMLRSLSSVELSGHAVELEKRSIDLSMEEAREIQRGR